MSVLEKLIKKDIKLPSPPAIAIQILEVVKKDDSSYADLGRIISADPALAAKTLRLANSSFYALPRKIESIDKAISIMGINALKNIALSFVIAQDLKGVSHNGFDFDLFWKRAVTAAIGADLFTALAGGRNDDTFVTGLLQDIGILVMYLCRPDDYMAVLDEKKAAEQTIHVIEKSVFGFDHQEVGSEILKDWGLPENIWIPIRFHHEKESASDGYGTVIDALTVSDKISSVYHGLNSVDKIEDLKKVLRIKYGLENRKIEHLVDSVAEKSIEMLALFDIDPGTIRPYSQILQEANEELGRLNLSYEHLLMKYKEEKERAQTYAKELKKMNKKLRNMASRDGLTGLYNHKYFQDALNKELSRAIRYGRPFSLIMFDLDHFKKVNDTHGHRIGDTVLKKVGETTRKTVRVNDTVARYGGEEFVIILPETDLKGAAVLAERLRQKIKKMKIVESSKEIRITISLGVATYLPGDQITNRTQILDAADAALYHAKNNGRNRFSIAKLG